MVLFFVVCFGFCFSFGFVFVFVVSGFVVVSRSKFCVIVFK